MKATDTHIGLLVALTVIGVWTGLLYFLLTWHFAWNNPLTYLLVFVQMHLFTGLFITAHDAMHGTVTPNKKLNRLIGYLCAFLYAGFFYANLFIKHHQHHKHVHTEKDPDYAPHGFWRWYFSFMLNYLTIAQLIVMAVVYNILKIWVDQQNLLLFWVTPSLLSTFQLFYFGTYLPHKGVHENEHHASTQKKNHFLAFISCYFFGYHLEHHQKPNMPWWQLYKSKGSV